MTTGPTCRNFQYVFGRTTDAAREVIPGRNLFDDADYAIILINVNHIERQASIVHPEMPRLLVVITK